MFDGLPRARLPWSSRLPWALLAAPFVVLALFASAGASVPTTRDVVLLTCASAAWAVAWWCLRGRAIQRSHGILLVAGALGLRCLALASPLVFSDDVWRYVFEGGVVAEGVSPYAAAPADPERAEERRRWPATYAGINHPEVPAAYPPVTQFWHAGIVALAGGPAADDGRRAVFALRVAALGLDVLVLLLLTRIAPGRAGPLVAWGFCPWLALEFAGAAHFDVLGVALLVAALGTRREGWQHALLALGGLVKFLPLAAAPWTLRRAQRPRLALAILVGVTCAGWGAAALLAGGLPKDGAGLTPYALRWESWNLVYRWIEDGLALWFAPDASWSDPRRLGRSIVALVFVAFAAWTWVRVRDPWSGTRATLAAFFVLTPTLHPWYLAWVLALFATRPSVAWTWVFALAPLAYLPLETWQTAGVWAEPAWFAPLVALPFFAALAFEARQRLQP